MSEKSKKLTLAVLRVQMDNGEIQSRLVAGSSFDRICWDYPGALSWHHIEHSDELQKLAEKRGSKS